jgi:hypothetical protein
MSPQYNIKAEGKGKLLLLGKSFLVTERREQGERNESYWLKVAKGTDDKPIPKHSAQWVCTHSSGDGSQVCFKVKDVPISKDAHLPITLRVKLKDKQRFKETMPYTKAAADASWIQNAAAATVLTRAGRMYIARLRA